MNTKRNRSLGFKTYPIMHTTAKTLALASLSAAAFLSAPLLTAAPHDLTANESIHLGQDDNSNYILSIETAEDDVVNETQVAFMANPLNPTTPVAYTVHQFLWEAFGKRLMSLDHTGGLILYADGETNSDYLALDPANKTIRFFDYVDGTNDKALTLYQDGNALKLGDGSYLPTDPAYEIGSVLTRDASGTINQDLTVGDDDDTVADLTVNGKLSLKHLTGAVEGPSPEYREIYYTKKEIDTLGTEYDVFVISPRLETAYVGMGRPPGHGYQEDKRSGLYTDGDHLGFWLNDAGSSYYRERLRVGRNSIYTGTQQYYFSTYTTYGPVSSVAWLDLINRDFTLKGNSSIIDTQAPEPVYQGGANLMSGSYMTALGVDATALGLNVDADSMASLVVGAANSDAAAQTGNKWVLTDELFVVGNGYDGKDGSTPNNAIETGERSNALTILKNGQATLTNSYWDPANPEVVPTDANASNGEALVVEGHASFKGEVTIARIPAQGDISMGAFQ